MVHLFMGCGRKNGITRPSTVDMDVITFGQVVLSGHMTKDGCGPVSNAEEALVNETKKRISDGEQEFDSRLSG